MEQESEVSRRRRLLKMRKEELEKLQLSSRAIPSEKISQPSSVVPQLTISKTSQNSSGDKAVLPKEKSLQHTILQASVDVAPKRYATKGDVNTQPLHTLRSSHISSANAEIMGDDEYIPDLKNWIPTEEKGKDEDTGPSLLQGLAKDKNSPLTYAFTLQDKESTTCRCVTDLKFHRKFEDVLLSSYSERLDGKITGDLGIIGVWGLGEGRGVLQRTLSAHAAVTALEVLDISPTLVVGGTSGGNILMWDTRVKTSLPITTFGPNLSDPTYSHGRQAVTGIRTTVASASPFFFSSSASGYFYKWSLSNSDYPVARSVVQDTSNIAEVPISCFDLPKGTRISRHEQSSNGQSVSMFAGTELGGVYRMCSTETGWEFDGDGGKHSAGVTSICAHPFGNRVAYLDDVVVSCSSDWTIRLWLLRQGGEAKQLGFFDLVENGRVNDVEWSTKHPTVFCAGDEAGVLSLFDISGQLRPVDAGWYQFRSPELQNGAMVCKVQWSGNGKVVCGGDSQGGISVWKCGSMFAGLPDADWTVQYLKTKHADE